MEASNDQHHSILSRPMLRHVQPPAASRQKHAHSELRRVRLLEPHDVNCLSGAEGKTGICVRVARINACDAGVKQNLPPTDKVDVIDSSRGSDSISYVVAA